MNESSNPFLALANPGVCELQPYTPGKPVSELEREYGVLDAVKLASNENPLGPSPRAIEAARGALLDLARYPDGNGFALKSAIAERHRLDPATVTLGNGSNDVLELIARAFVTARDEVIYSEHAFAVYPIVTQAIGATARVAKAHDGSRGPCYGHDLAAMRALVGEATRLVFIANPNNPTGTWCAGAELESFIADLPDHVIVVVDEAYFEYVDAKDYPDTVAWVVRYPNLIVTRTFSKAFGLAGLRVGYGISNPQVADLLNRVRQPFNVNSIALIAAEAALGDVHHLAVSKAINAAGMAQLTNAFAKLGLEYIPSVGNFLCVDLGRNGQEVYEKLLSHGVILRPVANYGLPNHIRVTVGTEEENQRVIDALGLVLQ